VHVQEFVELVRQERMLDAISYSRTHLSPWAPLYQADLQRALTALAFKAGTACAPYAALFSDTAWLKLAELFRQDLYRLHSMPPASQLVVHLQVALWLAMPSECKLWTSAGAAAENVLDYPAGVWRSFPHNVCK
jgi:macrophage erythroblast attacher